MSSLLGSSRSAARTGWPVMALMMALVGAVGLALAGPAWPAHAAASVTVTGPGGAGVANASGASTLQLRGSGFQSIKGGFGGIYVLFGAVGDNWRPSQGGVGGRDFLYVPDEQSKDNAGREKFVAFPGSETADSANGGQIAADGSWSTSIVVPGPTFTLQDAAGKQVEVDCRTTQCGVITIGAHGVINPSNETFTPVSFGGGQNGGGATPNGNGGSATTGGEAAPGQAVATPEGIATLGVDATTAVAGHAMAFTGRGFAPGEQVTAVLDDGLVAAGPLVAGKFGEVAATLPLPLDLRVGSHTLRLVGAASGQEAEVVITVRRDPSIVQAQEDANQAASEVGEDQKLSPWRLALVVAAVVFAAILIGSLTSALVARRMRRQAQRKSVLPAASADGSADQPSGRPAETPPSVQPL
ncbi:MAG: hypothetical protein LBH68_00995, partial [Bifidobacteriaceae bacterium]|nr:hypothetical protein [Bifidobacteriaceae bacterium]